MTISLTEQITPLAVEFKMIAHALDDLTFIANNPICGKKWRGYKQAKKAKNLLKSVQVEYDQTLEKIEQWIRPNTKVALSVAAKRREVFKTVLQEI